MTKPDIEVSFKMATVAGQDIYRPVGISALQWMQFWEAVRDMDFEKAAKLEEKLAEAKIEISNLEYEISDLEVRIAELEDE